MATLTGNVLTWGLASYPADRKLLLRFVPSSAAVTVNTIMPLREEQVQPAADGAFTVEIAPTTDLVPDVWYEIHAEWFYQHEVGKWSYVDGSRIPGKLRVPVDGGNVATLLERQAVPGSIVVASGPPAPGDSRVYIDWENVTSDGVQVYAPGGIV